MTTFPEAIRETRTELDLAVSQLAAIQRFLSARAAHGVAADLRQSRESQLDASRRADVLRRTHDALIAWTHDQLRRTGDQLHVVPPVRAVIAHRNEWFADRVRQELGACVDVVAAPSNGADAVGIAVAEQPDLMLVEDTLEMLAGDEVVRQVREFSPLTAVAAQVAYGDRVGALLDAGAVTVFTRVVPPADVAAQLRDLVSSR